MRRLLADAFRHLPADHFEPRGGVRPGALLDRHPDGRHVALNAGVYDLPTGRPVWAPDNAPLLAFADAGRQVIALIERTVYPPGLPSGTTESWLHRWTWPARQSLGTTPIAFPGWATELAVSPAGDLATLTWLEQDCAGFKLLRLHADKDPEEIDNLGPHGDGYVVRPNLLQGPAFSPDGRYAVAACSLWAWWAPGGEPSTPSPGGRLKAGHLAILDTAALTFSEQDVFTPVPPGWLPAHAPVADNEVMGEPEFTTPRTVRLCLPTGVAETFDLPD